MSRTNWAIWITLAVTLIAASLHAQVPNPRRDQVAAATARAVERLRAQIAREQVGRNVTVADILKSTGGNDNLVKTLQRSQMIGGPRWLDDQTCQVRLEIAGPRVAAALLQIVSAKPKESPIAPEVLAARLKQWDNRTFATTSTSTGAAIIEHVRPDAESPVWTPISDEVRQQAIAAAKQNAVGRVAQAIGSIPLAAGKTVRDALADPSASASVDQWLASRPVTQVEFRDDLQVAVTLATPASELADVVIDAAKVAEPERARVRHEIANRVAAGSRGSARAGLIDVQRATLTVSSAAPAWVNDQIDADGIGTSSTSRLMAARAAEADAQAQLRRQIDALRLNEKQTLGEAAARDPRLTEAINRTVARARASKVDYQDDGSARVRVSLQLHELWEAIAAGP